MMRTNDLKKLIQTQLKTITNNVYHKIADKDALYPHIVFSFNSVNLGDISRQDYTLNIDVWDKSSSTVDIDNLCDSVENLLQGENLPQENILPTFYLIDRRSLEDEDKSINHTLIRFQIQNYER